MIQKCLEFEFEGNIIIENSFSPFLSMIIDNLLSIYNFLPFQNSPAIKIDLSLVQNYPPIQQVLSRLCFDEQSDGETVEEIYFLLNEFIMKEEQTLGPKRFKKLIENVFTVISQYVINLLRYPHVGSQSIFFHLTYFKKNCSKYVDHYVSCLILIFYMISNFKMNQLHSIQEKIKQCRQLSKEMIKEKERQKEANIFFKLCALFESRLVYKQNNLKKAKDLCSKIISQASFQLTESIRAKRAASEIVKIQLLMSSLTVSQIYKAFGKNELYTFIINKCIEYSEKFLEENVEFLRFLNVDELYPKQVKIRLTRLQEKIRRVDLVEEEEMKKAQDRAKSNTIAMLFRWGKINHPNQNTNPSAVSSTKFANTSSKLVFSKEKQAQKKSTTFHYATLRPKSPQNTIDSKNKLVLRLPKNLAQKQVKKIQQEKEFELKNLLIVKDKKKNYYRLKEETLKYLKKENNQLKRVIMIKDREINDINQVKEKITKQFDVQTLHQEIGNFQKYESTLINEIEPNKWEYLNELPAVKKMNNYFKSFSQLKYYWHAKNVYSLVYGDMINMSQMKMISVLRRKARKQSKQAIYKTVYNNIKHQVEYIRQLKDDCKLTFFMNIYQIEKGDGINQQIQISEEEYRVIKYEPFYNFYSFYQRKLITFEQHIKSLSLKEAYFVKRFIKLMNRFNPSKGLVSYRKVHFRFNYNQSSFANKQNPSEKALQYIFEAIFLLKIHYLPLVKEGTQKSEIKIQNSKQNNEDSAQEDGGKSKLKINQKANNKMVQVTVEKVSNNKYSNPIYNFSLLTTINLPQFEFNQESLLQSIMCEKMKEIFYQFSTQIQTIQKHLKRKLSTMKTSKIKPKYHIQTHTIKGVLFTLVINKETNKNIFYIENIKTAKDAQQDLQKDATEKPSKKYFVDYRIFTQKDVTFSSLDFLLKISTKLQDDISFQDKYHKIEKYLKIKHFATKIFFKSKNIRFFTDFQTQFKRKLCFAIIKKEFLFRGKMRQGKIMFMLTVKQFSKIPRPYTFRIFTFDKNSDILINAEKTIYNKEKLFLESKISTINEVVEVISRHEFEIFAKAKPQATKKVSSRISILSNYSFQSEESSKDNGDNKGHVGMFNRRMSKNSMFAKFRHKALIKNQDLEAIKKLVEERKLSKDDECSSSSHSSRNSVRTPVKSVSSHEEESDHE